MSKARSYRGLLVIGDPHIEGRQPGFRKDDFPRTILGKVRWCIEYARKNRLLPTFLGDIFDKPRDNPTWMIGELIEMMKDYPGVSIYGNHDCADPVLSDNDSFSILVKAGCLKLVSATDFWTADIQGRRVVVAGSSYRQDIPQLFDLDSVPKSSLFDAAPFVVWLSHHDIDIGNYENGKFGPFEMINVDLLINGHIHREAKPVRKGQTTWMNPGNIVRRSRSEHSRKRIPSVLELTFPETGFVSKKITIPHQAFDEVFHESTVEETDGDESSNFVAGLKQLLNIKTDSGAGLMEFLDHNLPKYKPDVAAEIRELANDVNQNP